MKFIRLSAFFTLMMLLAFKVDDPKPVFKAGFAERDITPDIGMEEPGDFGKVYHKKFHDACKVRAVVFDDGKKRVAMVGIDLIFITRNLVLEARAEIEKRCGIPAGAIMIGASHSHSSGPMGNGEPGDFDKASALVKDLVKNKSITSDPGYLQTLKKQIVEAVVLANANRVDAKLAVGSGYEDKVSFNRRFTMKNGRTYTHPGVANPDIVDYAGPIDPEVGTVGVWDMKGKLMGTVVNFACHGTTNPGGISANWVGAMERTVRNATSNAALPVVFLQGACGDITQVDNMTKFRNPAAEDWNELVGGRVGAEAFKTLLLIKQSAGSDLPIDVLQKTFEISRRVPSVEKVKHALELVKLGPEKAGEVEWTFAKEILILDAILKIHPRAEVEVQAIQIGPILFASNPSEYFTQFGLDIKKASKFPFTFVVELANGYVGYVPTEEAFGANGGGYETRMTSESNLEVSAGRQFANAAIELSNQFTPGKIPMPPPAVRARGAWTYGNLPPEVD